MQTGDLLIDGVDAFTQYGAYLSDGQLAALLELPKLKTPTSTEWADQDGMEYDLATPLLDSRTLSLKFHLRTTEGFYSLIEVLQTGAYHTFNVPSIGQTYNLRLTQTGSLNVTGNLITVSLTFSEDTPAVPTGSSASAALIPLTGITFDGTDLAYYGIQPIEGIRADVITPLPQREALKVTTCNTAGIALYDSQTVTQKPSTLTLPLYITAPTVTELIRRYHSLLATLLSPDLHTIVAYNHTIQCFYQSVSITQLSLKRPFLLYSLTLQAVTNKPT
jgi:hypothetical protein